MYLVKTPSWAKGSDRYTVYLPCSPFKFLGKKRKGERHLPETLVPAGGLYQKHCQSLNTHGRKHRCGGAQRIFYVMLSWRKKEHINKIPGKSQENAGTVAG